MQPIYSAYFDHTFHALTPIEVLKLELRAMATFARAGYDNLWIHHTRPDLCPGLFT
jgi:hypothetical protein